MFKFLYVCMYTYTQRLGFARLLLNNPTLAILDEASSALDLVSEKVVCVCVFACVCVYVSVFSSVCVFACVCVYVSVFSFAPDLVSEKVVCVCVYLHMCVCM